MKISALAPKVKERFSRFSIVSSYFKHQGQGFDLGRMNLQDGHLKNLLIIAKKSAQIALLKRITSHISADKVSGAQTIVEAEEEVMKSHPSAIIIDVSDFSSREFQQKLEPFLLSIPGWVKTFFVDSNPTKSRVFRASKLGVNGFLRAPLSHHGISQLFGDAAPENDDEENH